MGQVPPKYFYPSAPYGASQAIGTLNPQQGANPQVPQAPNVSFPSGSTGRTGGPQTNPTIQDLFRGLYG